MNIKPDVLFTLAVRGAARPLFAAAILVMLGGLGCRTPSSAAGGPEPETLASSPDVVPPPTDRRPPPPTPQSNAAGVLVAKARTLYRNGRYDQALNRLEQATSIDPRNGPGHYWLAAVWLAKGDRQQAREHHRLALRYLGGRNSWTEKLERQAQALER